MTAFAKFEQNFYSTIRIVTRNEFKESIEGTAFVFEYKTEDNTYPFLITAKSNVQNTLEGRMTLMLANGGEPLLGKGYSLDIEHFERLWYSHPDIEMDIAVTPFVPFVKHIESSGSHVYFHALGSEMLAKFSTAMEFGLGDDTVFVCYPSGLWDKKHLLPVLRRGMIASSLMQHYMGKQQFLIDAIVMPGCAGSPVFHVTSDVAAQPYLLGMLVYALSHEGETSPFGEGQSQLMSDMGIVIRTEILVKTITAYLEEKGFL